MHLKWRGISEGLEAIGIQQPFSLLKVKVEGVEEQGHMSIIRVKGTISHHLVENFRKKGRTRSQEQELPLAGEQEEVPHARTTWKEIATPGHKAIRWRRWNGGEKITEHPGAEEADRRAGDEAAVSHHLEEIQHHRHQGEATGMEQQKGNNSEQDHQSTTRGMKVRMCSRRGRIGTRMETCYDALLHCAANPLTTQSSAKDAAGRGTLGNGVTSPRSKVLIQQDIGL